MLSIYLNLIDSPDDQDKFTQLYGNYKQTMFFVANKILNDKYLAEDAVHEAFLRVMKNLHKISDISCPQTKNFLVIIVKNIALTMKTLKAKKEILMADDDLEWAAENSYNLEDECLSKINIETIVNEIEKLPEIYKYAVYLEYMMDMNIAEISEMLSIPKETTKKRLQRGRKLLIEKIVKAGVNIYAE
jgi:RNA polymerase sigma-70 factor (ECF subfamily)